MNDRRIAEIWPSRAALEEELSRRAREQGGGGLLLCPPFHTFDSLLPKILAQVPLPPATRPLLPMAGPLLVHSLLRKKEREAFAGLAAGRRLPEGLWRLLVEVKAAGLDSAKIEALGAKENTRLSSLAALLADYESALKEKGLADQADQLSALEAMLRRGEKPVLLYGWEQLICRGVLWLRTLDIRLLRALAGVLEVRVEFAMWPQMTGQPALQRLLEATAKALEEEPHPKGLSLAWHDPRQGSGPLNDLINAYLDPAQSYEGQGADHIEFIMAAGRYGLAEAMVIRARELVQGGIPPHEVALVFPDLNVYGPMVEDVARRLRLPLNLSNVLLLGKAPLAQALLMLLELPLGDYEREALADVWASPYLRGPLGRMCLGPGEELPGNVGWLLKRAGYVDSKDWDGVEWLERAAAREEAKKEGNRQRAGQYRALAKALDNLKAILNITAQHNDIVSYCDAVIALADELDPATPEPSGLASLEGICLPGEAIQVRDLAAKRLFLRTTQDMLTAASQAGANEVLTAGRLLALLREALNQTKLPQGNGAASGVAVHRLADTMGIRPKAVLMGGLNQGEFPIRPQGHNLLSSADRLVLGKEAKRPVWRTDDEEYQGQVLRLAWLLANCSHKAVIGAAGADIAGRKQSPAIILEDLARLLGKDLTAVTGSIFGELPPLNAVQEAKALAGRLAADLLRISQGDSSLAQASLWHLAKFPKHYKLWRGVASRAKEQQDRLRLNKTSSDQRVMLADSFSGRLNSPEILALLKTILATPKYREMSPSSLETYAQCPMAWFVKYLLRIGILSDPSWTLEARSEGEWVHRTLALFFNPEEFDPAWDLAAQEKRLKLCMEEAKHQLATELAALPLVWEARQAVLMAALPQVIATEMEAMAGVRPWATERDIGGDGHGLEIQVDQGPPLKLKGRLDRLDKGAKRIVVSDYKHTGDENALRQAVNIESLGVTQFQLALYLAFARELMGCAGMDLMARIVPTLLATTKPRKLDFQYDDSLFVTDQDARDELAKQGKTNLYNSIVKLWGLISSGVFTALPEDKGCQHCDYRFACCAQAPSATSEYLAEI